MASPGRCPSRHAWITSATAQSLPPDLQSTLAAVANTLLAKVPSKQRSLMQNVVEEVVRAVEQTIPQGAPNEKKAAAMQQAEEMLAQLHIAVPCALLSTMIEAAVYGLNAEQAFNGAAGESSPASVPAATPTGPVGFQPVR